MMGDRRKCIAPVPPGLNGVTRRVSESVQSVDRVLAAVDLSPGIEKRLYQ